MISVEGGANRTLNFGEYLNSVAKFSSSSKKTNQKTMAISPVFYLSFILAFGNYSFLLFLWSLKRNLEIGCSNLLTLFPMGAQWPLSFSDASHFSSNHFL